PFDIAASNRRVDAGQILQHETAGTDVEVSDLGVAHLPRWQADVLARRMQEGVWAGRPQVVEAGSPRLADAVIGRLLAPAPAVKPDQRLRTALLHLHGPRASPASLKAQPPATTARRKVVWDCATIVNQRGRSPRISDDGKPCFSCHTGAISARR